MSKKHLTYDDRLAIQVRLQKGFKVAQITKNIGRDRTTTGREIKIHRGLVSTSNGNNCVHHETCTRIPDYRPTCPRGKRQRQTACRGCQEGCPDYQEEFCSNYGKSPFACSACGKRLRCRLRRMPYDAKYAQEQYESTLSEPRRGISLIEQELNQINGTISPLPKKGQFLPTICTRHRAELPVTDRAIYSYADAGLLDTRNIDLRQKLRKPERKRGGPALRIDRKCHMGQIYEDYLAHMTQNPDASICQTDSVMVHKGGQIVLVILLTTCDSQLMFLQERNMASSVTEILQDLRRTLGETYFRVLFQVIMTDHGSEFTDPARVETDPKAGTIQCRVFCRDPANSSQKNNYERDHELIRYVTPKNQAKERHMEEKICEVVNHINSYPRKKRNGQVPIDLFIKTYDQEVAELLSLRKILSDPIRLTPALLKKQAGNTYREARQHDHNIHPNGVHLQLRRK